jgi:ATP-dependent protease Clp ATPase subunit
MFKFRKLRCSFCRRDETEVAKLVAGPRVYICDACVTIASRIMDNDPNQPVKLERTIWQRIMDRISGLVRFTRVTPVKG